MLHFAPEPRIANRLRSVAERYVGVDLKPGFDCRVDITRLPFADGSFDRIVCCHVLEHIPDDAAAMQEFARVLQPDGLAVIQVPVDHDNSTDEDFTLDSEGRTERYGQFDHVRRYGLDIVHRLSNAGLVTTTFTGKRAEKLAVSERDIVFLCRRD